MRFLTEDEYKKASAFLKKKSLALWDIENESGIPRDFAQAGFPINMSFVQLIGENERIIVFENLSFDAYIKQYEKAYKKDKSVFRKGNAYGILSLMYEFSTEKAFGFSFERYCESIRTESCSYILHLKNEGYDNNVLRVDTFRKFDKDDKDETKFDFGGGLFHALNHFSLEETGEKHRNFMFDIKHLRYLSARAFYLGDEIPTEKKNTIIKTIKNPNHDSLIEFVFYVEPTTGVGFIKTITPSRKKQLANMTIQGDMA